MSIDCNNLIDHLESNVFEPTNFHISDLKNLIYNTSQLDGKLVGNLSETLKSIEQAILQKMEEIPQKEFDQSFEDLINSLRLFAIKQIINFFRESPLKILEKCKEIIEKIKYFYPFLKAQILIDIALYNKRYDQIDQSYECLNQAENLVEKYDNNEIKGLVCMNIAILKYQNGEHQEALELLANSINYFYDETLKIKLSDSPQHIKGKLFSSYLCLALCNFATIEQIYSNLKSADQYYREALRMAKNWNSSETQIVKFIEFKIEFLEQKIQENPDKFKWFIPEKEMGKIYREQLVPTLIKFQNQFNQFQEVYYSQSQELPQEIQIIQTQKITNNYMQEQTSHRQIYQNGSQQQQQNKALKRPQSPQIQSNQPQKLPSPHLRNYSVTFQKYETASSAIKKVQKTRTFHSKTIQTMEVPPQQPKDQVYLLKLQNVSTQIMNTHDPDCNCLICIKLFKLTPQYIPVLRKEKIEIPNQSSYNSGNARGQMGRLCAGFEINEQFLILAFQYFYKNEKGVLDVDEYLYKIDMQRYVAEYNWDIHSKLFFRCLWMIVQALLNKLIMNTEQKVLELQDYDDIQVITPKNQEWPANIEYKEPGMSEIHKFEQLGIEGYIKQVENNFSGYQILLYGINKKRISNNNGIFYVYIDTLNNQLVIIFEKLELLKFEQVKSTKFPHTFEISTLKKQFSVYDNKDLQDLLLSFIKWLETRIELDYEKPCIQYSSNWEFIQRLELQSLSCRSVKVSNSKSKSKLEYDVFPYGSKHSELIKVVQRFIRKLQLMAKKRKIINMAIGRQWRLVFRTYITLNKYKMMMSIIERITQPTGYFVIIETLDPHFVRTKDQRYINCTMKIEKELFDEIVQDANPWQYFLIHWKYNKMELANLILREAEIEIDSHKYNLQIIRHLNAKKYSIKIHSSYLKFDHSKYFDKQTVYMLKDEFQLEKYFLINLKENYYLYMLPKKIQIIQTLAFDCFNARKRKALSALDNLKEKIIHERSNEVLIQKLRQKIAILERSAKLCQESHMEKAKYEQYVANCKANHSETSDLIAERNRANGLQDALEKERIYKPMYLDMKSQFEKLEKYRDKLIADHKKQVEEFNLIIQQKDREFEEYRQMCAEEHVLKTDYQALEEKFEIKYWLVTNVEVQMHKFEYEKMKSAYQMLSERFHDYCWECLHHKIIPKDLGCLDVDLIRRIQRHFKKKIYANRRKELVFGEQWLFWQVFETFQYYTQFQNKFWFQIFELESDPDIKLVQCIHLSPPHWQKSIVLRYPEWLFFVCVSFQQNGHKKLGDIYKYFDLNAQLKVFNMKKSFKIYLSVVFLQKMWRIILKRWYYKRLEKFMKKVDCIYYTNKMSSLCIGFEVRVNQLSFETLKITGLNPGKQRHWTVHLEHNQPLVLKYLQSRKGQNFQIASQKLMKQKRVYYVTIHISGSDISNQYQISLYINGQMEKMMGQVPDIKIPTFIEIVGGETSIQQATTKDVSQIEIQDLYQYKTFFHEQFKELLDQRLQEEKRIQEIDFDSAINQYQIDYQTYQPILSNMQDIVKLSQILSPQISVGDSQLPLFGAHHLFSADFLQTKEKYLIEFNRFMQILNLLNIFIDAQNIYDLAMKFQSYKEVNATQAAIQMMIRGKNCDLADEFAVLKIQKIIGDNTYLTFQNVITDHLGQFERKVKLQCIIYDKFLINLQKVLYPALESERYFQEPDISILQSEFQIEVVRHICSAVGVKCSHQNLALPNTYSDTSVCPLDQRFEEFSQLLQKLYPQCTIIENAQQPSKLDQFDIFIRTPYNLSFEDRNKLLVKKSKYYDMDVESQEDVQEFDFFNIRIMNRILLLFRKNNSVEDFFRTFPVKMLQVFDSIAFILHLYPDLGKIQQQPVQEINQQTFNRTGKDTTPMKNLYGNTTTSSFRSFRPTSGKKFNR